MILTTLAAALPAAASAPIRFEDLGLSPNALDLGFFKLRWYSLGYLAGILGGWWYLLRLLAQPGAPMARRHADDMIFYSTIGIIAGGRIADVRGRRVVAAVALVVGTACTLGYFFSAGWQMWVVATVGTMVSAAAIPALGVYGPELFPTGLRGRANGLVAVSSLLGSATGLILCGVLSDGFGRIGPAMSILSVGPFLLAVLVLAAYPETAGRELEDLNPEDRPPTP